MVRGTPESKAAVQGSYTFDTKGVLTFMVTMVALQVLTTQGSQIGWTNPITLGLARSLSSLVSCSSGPSPQRDLRS